MVPVVFHGSADLTKPNLPGLVQARGVSTKGAPLRQRRLDWAAVTCENACPWRQIGTVTKL